MLRAERERLRLLLSPATPADLKVILGRLALHYSLGNAQQHEIKLLIEDYISDLSHLSVLAVQKAAEKYRRDPASQFFPKIGVLLELAKMTCVNEQNDLRGLTKMLEIIDKPFTPALDYDPKRPSEKDWQALRRELAPSPEPTPAPVHFPNREDFERKQKEQKTTEPDNTQPASDA